jgi:hypothetical protein
VREFSESIGESTSNTNNYIGARQTEPKPEYLAKVLNHFSSINAHWLLTGNGEPFLNGEPGQQTQANISGEKSAVNIAGGKATQHNHNYSISDCEKERDSYKAERDIARAELAGMRQQLEMAQALIAAKDEMLTLLRGGYNRPN